MNATDLTPATGVLRLTDLGVIMADGPDAAHFLHSQLTQSIQNLSADRARLAGYCSAKGRLLASFVAFRDADERIGLICSADLLAATLKRLSMFVLRAKCRLSDASGRLAVWGVAGTVLGQSLGPDATQAAAWRTGSADAVPAGRWIRLPDAATAAGAVVPRWLLITDAAAPAPEGLALSSESWAWLEVRSGIPRVTAATSDHFVPQMINFELIGGVDFQKGCYPGQEVVARSQYRGTLKRRMVMMHSAAELVPGAEIHHGSDPDQPAGEVVLAAPAPGGGADALVEVKLAMLEETEAAHRFSTPGGVLSVGTLPYAITSPA